MKPVLSLSQISYNYHTLQGETPAIKDISFNVNQGEFLAIVGPSGCGKSTLLHIIAGLLYPSEGSITMNGKPISNSITDIGYMLQKDHLLEHRTIYKNILLGLEIQKKITIQNLAKVDSLLKEYGLFDFRNSYPRQLSGGMRQRAALIRTLSLSPSLLLLDEPFSALDYQTRLKVSNDIGSILKKQPVTAILVTHDLSEAISMADRVLILSKRPGTVKKIVPIQFAKQPVSPEEARSMPEFTNYFNLIWKEIKYEK
jgi:NitT/TauT family transport system ATP-binding protein